MDEQDEIRRLSLSLNIPQSLASLIQAPTCLECGDTGWQIIIRGNLEWARPCRCRSVQRENRLMRGIDERFREATFENFTPLDQKQEKVVTRMKENPFGSYFLSGTYAIGKTHLMIAQYRQVAAKIPAEIRTSRELALEFRTAEMVEHFVSPVQAKADLAQRFHFFWDDVDKLKSTAFREEVIFHLVDRLYRRKLGITITSNLSLAQLAEHEVLEPAVIRRIDDMCEVFEL